MGKLSDADIETELKSLSGWTRDGIWIKKTVVRKNFVDAANFIQKIVPLAESMDHHPDVRIFAYKRVEISISTHSEGGLTKKDFELARKIESIHGTVRP